MTKHYGNYVMDDETRADIQPSSLAKLKRGVHIMATKTRRLTARTARWEQLTGAMGIGIPWYSPNGERVKKL